MAGQQAQRQNQRQQDCRAELLMEDEVRQISVWREGSFRSQEWMRWLELHLACSLQCTRCSVAQRGRSETGPDNNKILAEHLSFFRS